MGSIPSAVNIPLSNFEKALSLDGGDFQKTYGFRKPQQNQKIIVYCKAGKRSGTALGLAKGQGFSNVRNYAGSWLDVSESLPPRPFMLLLMVPISSGQPTSRKIPTRFEDKEDLYAFWQILKPATVQLSTTTTAAKSPSLICARRTAFAND